MKPTVMSLLPAILLLVACDGVEPTVVTSSPHDCAGANTVALKSSGQSFAFTGTCERVVVEGANNKVQVEASKRFDLKGANNTVEIGAVDQISIDGSNNNVSYKKGVSGSSANSSVMTGDNNSVVQAN